MASPLVSACSRAPGSPERWALVLAGGDGTRLQELTARIAGKPIPKQYCRIAGNRSMLEATLDRVRAFVPPERTLLIVNANHLEIAGPQLCTLPPANVLVQSENRDTGPGILRCLLHLQRRRPGAHMAVFPSDHYVEDDAAFVAHVAGAATLVARMPGKVVLLGIRPDRPEPGYGYVMPGPRVALHDGGAAFHVGVFHEKPPLPVAEQLVRRGGLWNSFVMVFAVDHMLALVQRLRPADFGRMSVGDGAPTSWNFSSGLLARIPHHLVVLRVDDTGWSDWGTPEAIERTFASQNRIPPWQIPAVARTA
jgi:mannose-1-phosphate guanylyltransferase